MVYIVIVGVFSVSFICIKRTTPKYKKTIRRRKKAFSFCIWCTPVVSFFIENEKKENRKAAPQNCELGLSADRYINFIWWFSSHRRCVYVFVCV